MTAKTFVEREAVIIEILDAYTEPLRSFMAADFRTTRKALKLSQFKMAELLDLDPRSYSNLERGRSLCGTRVFLRYVFQCKEDPILFMKQVRKLMGNVEKHLV